MTDDDGDEIEPRLSETEYYKTAHDVIETAIESYTSFYQSKQLHFEYETYPRAIASLNAILNSIIFPHNANNPNGPEVKKFKEKWESLNDQYGEKFERGERRWHGTNAGDKLTSEYADRYLLVMTYLNTLGLTRMRERGENWQDERIQARLEELK